VAASSDDVSDAFLALVLSGVAQSLAIPSDRLLAIGADPS
jgi:hypothetical protein